RQCCVVGRAGCQVLYEVYATVVALPDFFVVDTRIVPDDQPPQGAYFGYLQYQGVSAGAGGAEDGVRIIARSAVKPFLGAAGCEAGLQLTEPGSDGHLHDGVVIIGYPVHMILADDGFHFFFGDKAHSYLLFSLALWARRR